MQTSSVLQRAQHNANGKASAIPFNNERERVACLVTAADAKQIGRGSKRLAVCRDDPVIHLNAGLIARPAGR